MKIAFIVTRLEKPSARYRVLQFIPFLNNRGYLPEVFTLPKSFLGRAKLFARMKSYDIVFLQKKTLNALDLHMLRSKSKRLVYDFDDAVMFRDSNNREHVSAKRRKNFIRTVKNVDIVIAGNEYLKSFAIVENPKTYIIPTSINIERYTKQPTSAVSDTLTLGWIGSRATLPYLENMKNIWDIIFDRFQNVQLKIVADQFFDCDRMPVIKKQWRYEEEIDDLHSFDIGLMPLTDDPWSRGKCGLKLLQYMAVGLPVVCSPVGVNNEIVADGVNGFSARTEEEWIQKLITLIEYRELRLQIGKRSRATVIKDYSTETNGPKLIKLLESLN